ncbi:unnamed protein product [Phytomonas sp. Hart1]|nr:unnamed protein product [Phytomonas sp. Hart1]|eukprot:CCW68052.1 unnamed protein product [Phytomonas sp. isolate Hart1]
MRRFNTLAATQVSSFTKLYPSFAVSSNSRQFHSAFSLLGSCIMCVACMLCFASWGNNIRNLQKYGRWRFRNTLDDVFIVSDFKNARYAGAFFGFLFWWFVVGPQKYRWDSNLEQVPGNTRIGPF